MRTHTLRPAPTHFNTQYVHTVNTHSQCRNVARAFTLNEQVVHITPECQRNGVVPHIALGVSDDKRQSLRPGHQPQSWMSTGAGWTMCRLNRSAADDDAAASGDDVALGVLVVVGSLWAGHANGRCSVGGGGETR